MASDANVLELLLRLALSLGLVVAIIMVAAKLLRGKTGFALGRRGGDRPKLDVLDRTTVARHASVAVVRVGGRGLVVGITEHSITLLAEAPELIDRYEQGEAEQAGALTITTGEVGLTGLLPVQAGTAAGTAAQAGTTEEATRTGPLTEHAAPGTTRMNFFEALRETTVRRS